jgi:hypothetical protein
MRLSRFVGVAVLMAVFTGAAAPAQAQINLTGITNLQGVNFDPVTGVLTIASATLEGTLAGVPFTTDITNLVLSPGHGNSCSVLDLELAPISISLLGLHVDTSSICLTITAQAGGGVLGDLLCSLAGAGGILDTITGILNNNNFLSGLSNILNQALGHARHAAAGGGNTSGSVCTGDCTVLDVVLGPLNLKLLGVTVKLNNCSHGPVEVCVSATASEGVLGELLCGLAGGGGLSLQDLLAFIEHLVSTLGLVP